MSCSTTTASLRIPDSQWRDAGKFADLMETLERNSGSVDELAFFLSASIHSVLPLETVEELASILKERMETARKKGYRTGVNFLATLGHVDEYLENALKGDFIRMTGPDGVEAKGSFCPNDPKFRTHLAKVCVALVKSSPEFIWFDDDLRMANHRPVWYGCFCKNCLAAFNKSNGSSFNRESLASAFNKGGVEEKLRIRTAWMEHNGRTISALLSFLEDAVHRERPSMALGLMTIPHFYENNDFSKWASALAKGKPETLKWRPGGGFFSDGSMAGLIAKAHAIGRQIALLPKEVKDIQAEIENFPYQPMKKSKHATGVETAAYIAAGCNGAAFNILGFIDEKAEEAEPYLRQITSLRPFYDMVRKEMDGKTNAGICPAWNNKAFASNNILSGAWLEGWQRVPALENAPNEILELGLPPSYDLENGDAFLLSGDIALAMERKELEAILSKGVYMDGRALEHLNSLGLGELTGFKTDGWVDEGCAELLTSDSLNGGSAGSVRDCVQSFWSCPCAILSPLADETRALARKTLRSGGQPGFICMGAYENELGGRVAVGGYAPWTHLQSCAKSAQMKRLFRWLSRDLLSAYVSSYHKAALWARRDKPGKSAMLVLNASQDCAEGLSVSIRTRAKKLLVFDDALARAELRAQKDDGVYAEFILPRISPWNAMLLTF